MTLHDPMTTSALDEEMARAELYGLLSILYYAPPAGQWLAQMRVAATDAPTQGGFLEEPWRALVGAAHAARDAQLSAEYTQLFGSVGKPEVALFGSYPHGGLLNDKRLPSLGVDRGVLCGPRDEARSG